MTRRMVQASAAGAHITRLIAMLLFFAGGSLQAMAQVQWGDILQDPDNIELNERFVTERLAAGDLPAALSAVERVINLNPADIGLRLLRAEILVNLGNDTLATGELDALAQLPISADQRRIIARLQNVIDSRSQRWRPLVTASFGLQASDNANSYPSSGLLDFMINPATPASRGTRSYQSFGGATKTIRETASVAAMTASMTYERATQERETMTFGVSHSGTKGRKYQYLTNTATTVFASAALQVNGYIVQPQLRLTKTTAKTSTSSSISTASVSFGKSLGKRFSVFGGAEYSKVDQEKTTTFATANQNDGHATSYRYGMSARILSTFNLFVEGRLSQFNPMEQQFTLNTTPYRMSIGNKNKAETATIGLAAPLSNWGRFSISVAGTNTTYPNIETTSQIFRSDYRQRTNIGLQVNGTLFSQNLSAMTIGLSASTTRNDSNIRQYDYKRSDTSLTLNYKLTD